MADHSAALLAPHRRGMDAEPARLLRRMTGIVDLELLLRAAQHRPDAFLGEQRLLLIRLAMQLGEDRQIVQPDRISQGAWGLAGLHKALPGPIDCQHKALWIKHGDMFTDRIHHRLVEIFTQAQFLLGHFEAVDLAEHDPQARPRSVAGGQLHPDLAAIGLAQAEFARLCCLLVLLQLPA